MKGMPTIPGKDPEIMDWGEIAVVKRREKLNELLEHGDPFTGRFLCEFFQIASIAKEIVETERFPRYALCEGINGSKIMRNGPTLPLGDMSIIKPKIEQLKQKLGPYKIGYSLWENTYSFKDYDEMLMKILEVLLDKPKELDNQTTAQ